MRQINHTYLIIILVIVTALLSCSLEPNEITKKDQYAVSVPIYMFESNDLNDDASLQYQNAVLELYMIVIDESREEYKKILVENNLYNKKKSEFKNMRDLVINTFIQGMDDPLIVTESSSKINGLQAHVYDLTGSFDGIPIYYVYGIIMSDKHFYQVIAWTLKSREALFDDTLHNMVKSFKEVKKGVKKVGP